MQDQARIRQVRVTARDPDSTKLLAMENSMTKQKQINLGGTFTLPATPMQVALAWLLQRSPNILLIPGTSSVKHLQENLAAASLQLPPEAVAELDSIGGVVEG